MTQPTTSSEERRGPRATQVQHPKRGAIPSPLSDIEKAPIFTPNQGTEADQQTSLPTESDANGRKAEAISSSREETSE